MVEETVSIKITTWGCSMQISSLSTSAIPAFDSYSYDLIKGRETKVSSKQTAQIAYSDPGSSILLSLSSKVEFREATYTMEGIKNNPGQINSVSPEEVDSPLATYVNNFKVSYLEMIKKRVEYLLSELTHSINSSDTSVSFLNFGDSGTENTSAINGIEQMLAASKNISNSATITDKGYFSPEQTAQRIVQFALSFFDGGDRAEYIDMVKSAVMKGYSEARAAWGGNLPSVADDTISLAMQAFDQFAAGSQVDYTA